MTLIAVYVACLVLGGMLIGASILGFSKEAEAGGDHELGADHDHDHDHADDRHEIVGAGTLVASTLLSVRFWTFALAAFGLTGLLLTLLGIPAVVGAGVAALTGTVIGAGVSAGVRSLSRDTVSSDIGTRQLGGRDAEVVLSIGPEKPGKVRLSHQGQLLELRATTREPRIIERGERVLVVEVNDGTADVTPAGPERLAHPHPLATPE